MKITSRKILIPTLIILVILDAISTIIFTTKYGWYLESNPFIRKYELWGLILISTILILLLLLLNAGLKKHTRPITRYVLVTILVVGILIRLIIIPNNLMIGQEPPTETELIRVEQIANENPQEINNTFYKFALAALVQIVLLFIPFFFWRLDYKQFVEKDEL